MKMSRFALIGRFQPARGARCCEPISACGAKCRVFPAWLNKNVQRKNGYISSDKKLIPPSTLDSERIRHYTIHTVFRKASHFDYTNFFNRKEVARWKISEGTEGYASTKHYNLAVVQLDDCIPAQTIWISMRRSTIYFGQYSSVLTIKNALWTR